MDETDLTNGEEGVMLDPEVVASDNPTSDSPARVVKTSPAFPHQTNPNGKYQPLSHGITDPSVTVQDRVTRILMSGVILGKRLYSFQPPSTSEMVYGTIDILAGASLINQYMGKSVFDLKGIYLSSVQILLGVITSA